MTAVAGVDRDADVAGAVGGDEAAFARLADRHRRELHVHCYRMLASFDDAKDAGSASPGSNFPTGRWRC